MLNFLNRCFSIKPQKNAAGRALEVAEGFCEYVFRFVLANVPATSNKIWEVSFVSICSNFSFLARMSKIIVGCFSQLSLHNIAPSLSFSFFLSICCRFSQFPFLALAFVLSMGFSSLLPIFLFVMVSPPSFYFSSCHDISPYLFYI